MRYLEFANVYYLKDGRPSREVSNVKESMRPLQALYSHTLAREFGPKDLKTVQNYMVQAEKLCRTLINARIKRLRRVFKWAVSEELIPPAVYQGLCAVDGLRYGRTTARESAPVLPVAEQWIEATLPFLPPQVADMIRLQRLTGLRPGNLTAMRPCDLDMSGDVWVYRPPEHKTRYLGRELQVAIGPRGQEILRRYLSRPIDACLFSPQEAEHWCHDQRRQQPTVRRTPVYPCERRRLAAASKARQRRQRKRPPRGRYDTNSYLFRLDTKYWCQRSRGLP